MRTIMSYRRSIPCALLDASGAISRNHTSLEGIGPDGLWLLS